MPSDLALRIERTDPRLLLPQGIVPPDRLTLVDSLNLPSSGPALILSLLLDAEGQWHVVPLIDDEVAGLRRARAGDGWSIAAADWLTTPDSVSSARFIKRSGGAESFAMMTGVVSESTERVNEIDELVVVGERTRIRLALRPNEASGQPLDVIAHLRANGLTSLASSVGDVVWRDDEDWVAPIFGVAEVMAGTRLDEAFGVAAARHLRGGEDPEPTLVLARGLAELLAALHVALATSSSVFANPIDRMSEEDSAELARAARESVSEAVVLTDTDTQAHVRARTRGMRDAFSELADAVGTPCLPPAPFISLQQGSYLSEQDQFSLDPLLLVSADVPRPAADDVAHLLRALNHVAHGALRRLVGGGESVPVERVNTWIAAVREVFLAQYQDELLAAGKSELFNDRLLLGLEIQAECRALSYAARHLSTWATVPDAGLLDLLPSG